MKPFVRFALAFALLACGVGHGAETPLIPRALLFGNPTRQFPLISPDGSRISWLAPGENGVMNVWASAFGGDSARQITRETHRPVQWYGWAGDGRHLSTCRTATGTRTPLRHRDLETGAIRDLTPLKARAQNVPREPEQPRHLLVGLNQRPPGVRHVPRGPCERRDHARGPEPGDVPVGARTGSSRSGPPPRSTRRPATRSSACATPWTARGATWW
jgi:hypothetical protein